MPAQCRFHLQSLFSYAPGSPECLRGRGGNEIFAGWTHLIITKSLNFALGNVIISEV